MNHKIEKVANTITSKGVKTKKGKQTKLQDLSKSTHIIVVIINIIIILRLLLLLLLLIYYDYYYSTHSRFFLPLRRVLFLKMLLILFDRSEPANTPAHLANHLVLFSIHQTLHSPLRQVVIAVHILFPMTTSIVFE